MDKILLRYTEYSDSHKPMSNQDVRYLLYSALPTPLSHLIDYFNAPPHRHFPFSVDCAIRLCFIVIFYIFFSLFVLISLLFFPPQYSILFMF